MQVKNPVLHSLGHSILVLGYVSLVSLVMSHGNQWFGQKDNSFTPIAVLMLFVLSAAITASLVLGRPVLMYMEGQKKEALKFLGYTIAWLAVLTLIVFVILISVK